MGVRILNKNMSAKIKFEDFYEIFFLSLSSTEVQTGE